MYDQFAIHEAPVYEISKTPFKKKVETPHANRKDLTKPYASSFNAKAESAPTDNGPKTNALYEWGIFIANRDSVNSIALKVNAMFKRNDINGENFQAKKAEYLEFYKQLIGE